MWTNWLENIWHEFVDISRNQYRFSVLRRVCKWRGHNDVHDKIGIYGPYGGMIRWFTCTRCGRDGFRKIDDADLLPEEREIKERAEKHFRDHPEMYASVVTFNIRTGAAITTRVFGAEDEY